MKARLLMKLILRLNIGLHRIKWSWIGSMLLWRTKFCLLLLFRLPLNPHESLLKSDLHLNHRTVSCNYATSYFVRTVRDDLSIADYLDKLNSVSDNLALASNLLLMVIWFRSSWIMLVQLMRWLWVQPSPVTNRSLMMILEHYFSVLKGIFPVIKSQMISDCYCSSGSSPWWFSGGSQCLQRTCMVYFFMAMVVHILVAVVEDHVVCPLILLGLVGIVIFLLHNNLEVPLVYLLAWGLVSNAKFVIVLVTLELIASITWIGQSYEGRVPTKRFGTMVAQTSAFNSNPVWLAETSVNQNITSNLISLLIPRSTLVMTVLEV